MGMNAEDRDLTTAEGLAAAVERFQWELPNTRPLPGALMGLVMGHQHASEYLLRALGNLSAGDRTQVAHAIETWCKATDGYSLDTELNDALRKFAREFENRDMPGDQWVRFVERTRQYYESGFEDDGERTRILLEMARVLSDAISLDADPDPSAALHVLCALARASVREGSALYLQWDLRAPAVQGEDPGHREPDPDVPFDDLTALNVLCASVLGETAWNAIGALAHLVGEGPVLAALNDLSPAIQTAPTDA